MAKKNKNNSGKNDGGLFGLLGLLGGDGTGPDLSMLGGLLSDDEKDEFVKFVQDLDNEDDDDDDEFGIDAIENLDLEKLDELLGDEEDE